MYQMTMKGFCSAGQQSTGNVVDLYVVVQRAGQRGAD